jgi:hypothetical protein
MRAGTTRGAGAWDWMVDSAFLAPLDGTYDRRRPVSSRPASCPALILRHHRTRHTPAESTIQVALRVRAAAGGSH